MLSEIPMVRVEFELPCIFAARRSSTFFFLVGGITIEFCLHHTFVIVNVFSNKMFLY